MVLQIQSTRISKPNKERGTWEKMKKNNGLEFLASNAPDVTCPGWRQEQHPSRLSLGDLSQVYITPTATAQFPAPGRQGFLCSPPLPKLRSSNLPRDLRRERDHYDKREMQVPRV